MTDEATEPHVTCVAHGVDTFYLNVLYTRPDDEKSKGPMALEYDLAYLLDDLKSIAKEQEQEIASPWTFQKSVLMMQPHGAGKGQWSWLLTSPLLNLTVSHGRLNGIIAQVRFSSQFLWSEEWCGDALYKVHRFLMDIFGEHIYLQVSEVHLCADVMHWKPDTLDWQERFVSRAVGDGGMATQTLVDGPDNAQRRWKRINALTFGQHKSRVSCVIYNKTLEITTKSHFKTWFYELWKRNGWDEQSDIWRIEVRFKREFLHGAQIEEAYDFLNKIRDLWAYAVGHMGGGDDGLPNGWIRLVIPGTDTNRARWEVDDDWKVIQAAFDDLENHRLGELVFQVEKERNIERLVSQISGCVSSLAAQGADLYPVLGSNLYDTMEWVTHAIESHCKLREISFSKVVSEKRLKLVSLD